MSKIIKNIGIESLFIGALLRNTDLFITYKDSIIPNEDFTDEAVLFIYNALSLYYSNHSNEIEQTKVEVFMSLDKKRLEKYKNYGGYSMFENFMEISDDKDIIKYYDSLKKYSLLREMQKKNFPIKPIVESNDFEKMTAEECFLQYQKVLDSVQTKISGGEASKSLGHDSKSYVKSFIKKPSFGTRIGLDIVDNIFMGVSKKQILFQIHPSNNGKTRELIYNLCYVGYIEGEPTGLISNEMTYEDVLSCMIVSIYNNECFHQLLDFKINDKIEQRNMELAKYMGDNGLIIERQKDGEGIPIINDDDFEKLLIKKSTQYRNIIKIAEFIEENPVIKFRHLLDYSDENLILEMKKMNVAFGIEFFGYDVLKCYELEEWTKLKRTATVLSETCKNNEWSLLAMLQSTDESRRVEIELWDSNQIASAKGVYQVSDSFTGARFLMDNELQNYKIKTKSGIKPIPMGLLKNGWKLKGKKVLKNRRGSTEIVIAYLVNGNYNQYKELGLLIKNDM